MPNPPKLDPARGLRGRALTRLPAKGREGKPPAWPLPEPATAGEREVWTDLWKLPQAVAWERMGCQRVVARYARLLVRGEAPGAGPTLQLSINALEDRLGLTPKAMRLLLWEIATDEVAEKRQTAGVRGRIKAVADPGIA